MFAEDPSRRSYQSTFTRASSCAADHGCSATEKMTVHAKREPSKDASKSDASADQAGSDEARAEELTDASLKKLVPEIAEDENAMVTLRAIRDLQKQHDEVFEEYVKAKQTLEERFEKRFAPLFNARRSELDQGKVPDFWARCFDNCELLSSNITEKDALALRYLDDVSCETVTAEAAAAGSPQGLHPGSYVLRFRFRENPFFSDKELTKTYAVGPDAFDDFPEARGCDIHWKPGKDLTVRVFRKKSKNGRVLVKTQPTDSFFNFFSPPDGLGPDDDVNSDIENVVEADVELGEAIRNDLIPRALYYYLDMEDDDDEEDADSSGEDDVTKGKQAPKGGGKKVNGAQA